MVPIKFQRCSTRRSLVGDTQRSKQHYRHRGHACESNNFVISQRDSCTINERRPAAKTFGPLSGGNTCRSSASGPFVRTAFHFPVPNKHPATPAKLAAAECSRRRDTMGAVYLNWTPFDMQVTYNEILRTSNCQPVDVSKLRIPFTGLYGFLRL